MAKTRPETIKLIGYPQRKEGRSAATCYPGHLMVKGVGALIAKAGTAKLVYSPAIVLENELVGGDINTVYAIGDRIYYGVFSSGEEAQVRIPAAAAAIADGDYLEADATGCFRKWTDGIKLAQSMEAVDNSAGAAEAFLKVRFL
jgi:hypothetical protein